MSGGPIPPPPCAWHPRQLKAVKSCFPWLRAYALSPYGPSREMPLSGCTARADSAGTAAGGGELWKSRFSRRHAPSAARASIASAAHRARSAKREDIERSSLRCRGWQILHRCDESERSARVVRVEPAGDDRSRPSTHAREHGDVLL